MLDHTQAAIVAMAKQTVLPPLPPAPSRGFFSTASTSNAGFIPGESLTSWLGRLGSEVFQRTHDDIKQVAVTFAADGAAAEVKPVKYAMDTYDLKGAYSLGGGMPMPDGVLTWYASQSFIGYQTCAILAQHWFIDKACTMPARDAIRNGFDIARSDGGDLPPKLTDEIRKLDKRFKLKSNCVEAVRKCRMFGIRIVLFEINSPDPDYYIKPFNPDGITPGSYKGMSQVDPYWITPELDFNASANPASRHFYEPTYWRINGKRYHRTHLIVLRTCEVPDVLKPTYFYGGIPLPQRLYERCYAADRSANEGPQLLMTKRTTVVQKADLAAAAMNQTKFFQRIAEWAYTRDNYGVRISGGEEEVTQFDTALADVDAVIMTQYQLACSIAEVPATKMLGTQPKGFNSTGEYEEATYHESLESIQEHDMAPIIERHHLLCMRAYIAPRFKLEPFETTVEFADLDAETAKEKADREMSESTADKNWSEAGAIDGLDIRSSLIKRRGGRYQGIEEALPPGIDPTKIGQPGGPPAPQPPGQFGDDPQEPPKPGAAQPPKAAAGPPPQFQRAQDAALGVIAAFMASRAAP